MPALYSNNIPYTFSIGDYGTGYNVSSGFNQVAYDNVTATYDNIRKALGYVSTWYIAQVFLNDGPTALAYQKADTDRSQTTWFVLQWGGSAPDNICSPTNNYGNIGVLDGTTPQTSYGTTRGLTEWGQYW